MTTKLILVGTVGFAGAVLLTPLAIALARRTGFVDRPGPLKPQDSPVPLLGGLAVWAASLTGAAVSRPTIIFPLAAALLLGLADDRLDLPPSARLVGQAAIGAAVAAVLPLRFAAPGGDLLVVVATMTLINGVNFLDGLDGLASSVVAICAGGFALLHGGTSRELGLAVGAALAGFLLYNRPSARVYLGDGGSYFLGAALSCLLASAWAPGEPMPKSVAALCMVALPVSEIFFALVRRLRGHRSITGGDRRHPYDLLVARGWSAWSADLAYASAQATIVAAAIATSGLVSVVGPLLLLAIAACVLVAIAGLCGALAPEPKVCT